MSWDPRYKPRTWTNLDMRHLWAMRPHSYFSSSSFRHYVTQKKRALCNCFASLWDCHAPPVKKGSFSAFRAFPLRVTSLQHVLWLRNHAPGRWEGMGGWAGEESWPPELNLGQGHGLLQPLTPRADSALSLTVIFYPWPAEELRRPKAFSACDFTQGPEQESCTSWSSGVDSTQALTWSLSAGFCRGDSKELHEPANPSGVGGNCSNNVSLERY